MKKVILLSPLILLFACGPNAEEIEAKIKADLKREKDSIEFINKIKEEAIASVKSEQKETKLAWNYSGNVDKYRIKAQINYGEGVNSEGTGSLQIPVTGYYFYESQNKKIPIEGSANGAGIIYFVAHTSDGDESFDGEFLGSMLEDFSGTWSKGNKELQFTLNAKK